MAMSRKEAAEYSRVMRELRVRAALRFTSLVKPDIPVPSLDDKALKTGWTPIGVLGNYPRVDVACSSSVFHAIGRIDRTTSQGAIPLYSTELLALRGLRNEAELRCAEELARIDVQIDDAEKRGPA